jgi:spermidine synthase
MRPTTLLAVFLVAASMLALETLLPRLYAVYVGPNFVFFSISLALAGLSAGGIVAVLHQGRAPGEPRRQLCSSAALFAVSTLAAIAFTYAAGTLFNSIVDRRYEAIVRAASAEGAHDLTQAIMAPAAVFVVATGVVMALPFLFAGLCLALAFRTYAPMAGRVYAADLFGAAAGCVLTVLALHLTSLGNALVLVCLLAATASVIFHPRASLRRPPIVLSSAGIATLFVAGLTTGTIFDFRFHRYAHLRSLYEGPLEEESARWTPLGRIAVVTREWSPPLNATVRMRQKRMVAMDLGGHAVVERFTPSNLQAIKRTSVFSDDVMEPVIVPGLYGDMQDYLVLMAGAGQDMLRLYAWYGDRVRLEGVELNRAVFDLGLQTPDAQLAAFFAKPTIAFHIGDGRTFVQRTNRTFDVINLSYSGATFAVGSGALATTPQFLFTQEAFATYLRRLNPGGAIVDSVNTDIGRDPRSLRTFAAALGEVHPGVDVRKHVIAYTWPQQRHRWYYAIFHGDPLDPARVERARVALAREGLEMIYPLGPGHSAVDVGPVLAGRDEDFPRIAGFPRLAEDRIHADRQPFYYFDLASGRIGSYLFLGYVLTFTGASAIAAFYLLVPLLLSRRQGVRLPRPPWQYHVSFAALGFGFMLVEAGAIQRFELFLGSPSIGLIVILGLLLASAGIGSWVTSTPRVRLPAPRMTAFLAAGYTLLLLVFLDEWIYPLMRWPLSARIVGIAVALAPFGVAVGTLFPMLIGSLRHRHVHFVPWAIAINGICSVAASNLGALVYILFGANVVIGLGGVCYAVVGLLAPSPGRHLEGDSAVGSESVSIVTTGQMKSPPVG